MVFESGSFDSALDCQLSRNRDPFSASPLPLVVIPSAARDLHLAFPCSAGRSPAVLLVIPFEPRASLCFSLSSRQSEATKDLSRFLGGRSFSSDRMPGAQRPPFAAPFPRAFAPHLSQSPLVVTRQSERRGICIFFFARSFPFVATRQSRLGRRIIVTHPQPRQENSSHAESRRQNSQQSSAPYPPASSECQGSPRARRAAYKQQSAHTPANGRS